MIIRSTRPTPWVSRRFGAGKKPLPICGFAGTACVPYVAKQQSASHRCWEVRLFKKLALSNSALCGYFILESLKTKSKDALVIKDNGDVPSNIKFSNCSTRSTLSVYFISQPKPLPVTALTFIGFGE